ncbi:hypothetical protein GGI35DRAFT_464610 [Trichoderma velutinum]
MGSNGISAYPQPSYTWTPSDRKLLANENALPALSPQRSHEVKSRPTEISYQQGLYSQPDPSSSIPSEQGPRAHQNAAFTTLTFEATTTKSQPRSITSPSIKGSHLRDLCPAPPSGVVAQRGVASPYGPGSLMQPNSLLLDGEQPNHVVGSQGRRGILPSAPGQPPTAQPTAQPADTGAENIAIPVPVKDADGRFPCSQCTKTYLHAKHLKRHLLRHTGERPYICILCRDTFSRSDILKRHFDKCALRRGNPTGASHLSDSKAYANNRRKTKQKSAFGCSNQTDKAGCIKSTGLDSSVARNMPAAENGVPTYPDSRPNEPPVLKCDSHGLILLQGYPAHNHQQQMPVGWHPTGFQNTQPKWIPENAAQINSGTRSPNGFQNMQPHYGYYGPRDKVMQWMEDSPRG